MERQMSLIKQHLHQRDLEAERDGMIELCLPLRDVEYVLSYLDEEKQSSPAYRIAEEIRTQTYA